MIPHPRTKNGGVSSLLFIPEAEVFLRFLCGPGFSACWTVGAEKGYVRVEGNHSSQELDLSSFSTGSDPSFSSGAGPILLGI